MLTRSSVVLKPQNLVTMNEATWIVYGDVQYPTFLIKSDFHGRRDLFLRIRPHKYDLIRISFLVLPVLSRRTSVSSLRACR